jgi:glycosyltransferase involved in cell wall biosynthesis
VDILRKYAPLLSWWVSEPDRGQADAINKGFAHATGEVIAWLNSDDMYAPGTVASAVRALEAHPRAGLVYGRAVSITPHGRPLNDLAFDEWGVDDLAAFNILTQPAVFVRREAWEAAGGLDASYHLLLDHHLWLRIAARYEMVGVPEVWAFARHHPAAKNVAQAEKFGQEGFRILDWMKTDPLLALVLARSPRKMRAAALRFSARYLLDGGKAWPALTSYLHSLVLYPPAALKEWHRLLFAGLSVLGLSKLGEIYYRAKRRRSPTSMPGVENVNELFP